LPIFDGKFIDSTLTERAFGNYLRIQ